jgi:hypothetical protein
MSLLGKTNPNATWKSVLRRALVQSIIGCGLFGAWIWWKDWLDGWQMKLAICAILTGGLGALWEWQVGDSCD